MKNSTITGLLMLLTAASSGYTGYRVGRFTPAEHPIVPSPPRQKAEVDLSQDYKLGVLDGMTFTHNYIQARQLGRTNFNAPTMMRSIVSKWEVNNQITFTNE